MKDPSVAFAKLTAEVRALRQKLRQREAAEIRRRNKDEAAQPGRALFKNLFQSSPVILYAREPFIPFAFTYVSDNVRKQLGFDVAEFLRTPNFWKSRIHFEDEARTAQSLAAALTEGGSGQEYRFLNTYGRYVWLQDTIRLIRNAESKPLQIEGHWLDITERRQLERSLADEKTRFHRLADTVGEIVWTRNAGGDTTAISPSAREVLGYEPDEFLNKSRRLWWKRVHPADAERVRAAFRDLIRDGTPYAIDYRIRRADGSWIQVREKGIVRRELAGGTQADGILVEIERERADAVTAYLDERERLEKALTESVQRYMVLFEETLMGIFHSLPDGRFLRVNPAMAAMFGYASPEEMVASVTDIGRQLYVDPVRRAEFIKENEATEGWLRDEALYRRKDGSFVIVNQVVRKVFQPDGTIAYYEGFMEDVTERRRAEAADRRSRDLLRTVIDSTPDWIFVKDLDHRYLLVNRSFAAGNGVQPPDMVGRPDTDFWPRELCFGDPARNVRGYREDDKRVFAGEVVRNPDNSATLADGTFRLYDTIKLPLRSPDGTIYGVLGYSRDVTERRAAEAALQAGLDRSRHSFSAAVEAMAAIGELRDPYTAGHQDRVARLSCAIAAEIGIAPDRIEEIRIGGLLHDMGKISIPAEILTKPGKLSAIEFGLLKTHPRLGYDIVAKANFPPEIADIVLHHHERLDGSGYPDGLKGDAFHLEARCLAVADVVEAMSSDRPYRPAAGIDAALKEIARGKGTLYDERVVDACLRLFRDKGFVF
jgi:PAS domain S-box-containing protein/putative nucleotidyltransferase with HDIG domain